MDNECPTVCEHDWEPFGQPFIVTAHDFARMVKTRRCGRCPFVDVWQLVFDEADRVWYSVRLDMSDEHQRLVRGIAAMASKSIIRYDETEGGGQYARVRL